MNIINKINDYLNEGKNSWNMTDIQIKKCKNYLKGKLSKDDMYMLYKTYMNEYIKKFGYESSQKDSIETILNNFCKEATK